MNYNERAMLMAEANHPAYRPTEVLEAQVRQHWDEAGEPRQFTEGDRVWVQPRLGRGFYGLVLETVLLRSEHDCVRILAEVGGRVDWWASHRITVLRSV